MCHLLVNKSSAHGLRQTGSPCTTISRKNKNTMISGKSTGGGNTSCWCVDTMQTTACLNHVSSDLRWMLLSLHKTKSLARFGCEFAKWLLLEACVNLVITGNTFALERVSANRSVQVRTADFNFFFLLFLAAVRVKWSRHYYSCQQYEKRAGLVGRLLAGEWRSPQTLSERVSAVRQKRGGEGGRTSGQPPSKMASPEENE